MSERPAERWAGSSRREGRVGLAAGLRQPLRRRRPEPERPSAATAAPHVLPPRRAIVAAIVRRDYLVVRSYRLSFALDAVYGVIFLSTYYFISRTFEGVPTENLQGAPSYFAFAAVGAAIGAVVESASSGMAARIREEQLTGTLEMLAVQPMRSFDLCLGLVGFPFLFGLFRAALYLAVAIAWLRLDLTTPSWPGVVVIFLLTGAALVIIGIVSGAFTLLFKRGAIIVGFLLFAMTLLSGSVFPISTLPSWLEPVGKAIPLRFAFDGARSALFQGGGWEWDALWLGIFGLVGIPIAAVVFDRALHYTKRKASLGQY